MMFTPPRDSGELKEKKNLRIALISSVFIDMVSFKCGSNNLIELKQ